MTDKEPHAYRHAPSDDNHEPEPGCPCYYCHGLAADHDDYEPPVDFSGHDYRPAARGGVKPCPRCGTTTDDHA